MSGLGGLWFGRPKVVIPGTSGTVHVAGGVVGAGGAARENLTAERGTLTKAGAAGVNAGQISNNAFTANASTFTLTSGTPGHFTLPTDGTLPVPTSAGDTADLNGGPYVFDYTLTDGVIHRLGSLTISTLANAFTVATITELAAVKASSDGKTIKLARGSTNFATSSGASPIDLGGMTLTTGVTITSENAALPVTIGPVTMASSTKVTLSHLNFYFDNSAGTNNASDQAHALLYFSGTSNPTIGNCTFKSHSGSSSTLKAKRFTGIRSGSNVGAISVTNCTFDTVYNGMTLHGAASANVTDNIFRHVYQDGIGGSAYLWDIERNNATQFEGDYGSRFAVTFDSGTPAVGETYTAGSGTSQKVVEIAAVDTGGGTVDAYYNLFAKPSTEQYTGPSGKKFTVKSNPGGFSGIHGDFAQPIMDDGVINRDITSLTFKDNFIYRTAAFDHSVRQVEQGMQGLLAKSNGTGYHWGTVDVQGNVYGGGQDIGLTIEAALGGTVAYNTIISAEFYTSQTHIRVTNSSGLSIYNNVGDNGTDGPISGASPYLVDTDPTNSSLTIANKGGVRVTPTQIPSVFPAAFTYPQSSAAFSSFSGTAVELAKAGALATNGTFRAKDLPGATDIGFAILDNAATSTNLISSNVVTKAAYAPPAGTNRRVIVAVTWHGVGGSAVSCTFGGVAMPQIAIKGSASTLVSSNEGIALFALPEVDWPAGTSFDVVGTVTSTGTSTQMAVTMFTLNDSPAAVSASSAVGITSGANTSGLSASITPAKAGSLVISTAVWSANQNITYTGVSQYLRFGYPTSTRTLTVAQADQGAAVLTVTQVGSTTGRGAMIVAAWPPS